MKTKKRIKNYTFVYWSIALLLFIFWIVYSLLTIHRVSFSVITIPTQNSIFYKTTSLDLFKGSSFTGEFTSKDDNLGIILVELIPNGKLKESDNKVIFKLKELGRDKWDYSAEYEESLFDSQSFFTFGFPTINDSSGKNYVFELSLSSKEDEARIWIKKTKTFITGYQYSHSEITKPGIKMVHFISTKAFSSFIDPEFIAKSIIYLLPLIAFSVFVLLQKRGVFDKKYLKLILPLLFVLQVISPEYFFINKFVVLFFLWLGIVLIFKFKSKISFIFSLLIITAWLILLPFISQDLQKYFNTLSYGFLIFGCIQLLFEERKKK